MLKEFVVVFIGGGIGSVLRYGVQVAMNGIAASAHFPWATFAANIAGSFLIGLFYALSARFHFSPEVRLLLTTGLCGGFTTFSTFSNESLSLLKQGNLAAFALYVVASISLGIGCVFIGSWCGKHLFAQP